MGCADEQIILIEKPLPKFQEKKAEDGLRR
jgi:hypothetical protein